MSSMHIWEGTMAPLLEVRNLTVRYGAVVAVTNACLTVEDHEIVTIIGSNGAGKSSLLNAIVGLARADTGEVSFAGRQITRWPSHRIVSMGMGMVPEGRHVFPQMTVLDNLLMGAFCRSDRSGIAADLKHMFTLFPRLHERQGQMGGTLSGGEQQMLAIARALMARVRLLLLDEPSLGLAPTIIRNITDTIAEINRRDGIGVLLVEQNARMALSLANRAYVIETGQIVADGPADQVAETELVRKAYLGL